MNQDQLQEAIETHEILRLPPEQRLSSERLRMEFVLLVMRYCGFEQKLEKRLRQQETVALVEQEDEMEQALYQKKGRAKKFDSFAFLTAFNSAVKGYDASAGVPFLGYFHSIYSREIVKTAQQQRRVVHQEEAPLTRDETRIWKELTKLCEKLGLDWNTLPASYYKKIADYLGMSEQAVRGTMQKCMLARRLTSLDEEIDDDGNTPDAADPDAEDPQTRLERMEEILKAVTRFADLDAKEYPKLFFTNDILAPLREKNPAVDPGAYCGVLKRVEPTLWRGVFVPQYISFVFAPPPEPDCVQNLLCAKMLRPLQDASIAAYKNVSAAAVSYQRKKYAELQRSWRKAEQKAV